MTVPVYPQQPSKAPPGGPENVAVPVQGGGPVTFNPRANRTTEMINGTSIPTAVNINAGWIGQVIYLSYKQGAVPSALTLGPTIVGTLAATYTATNTAGARDVLVLQCLDGFNWGLLVATTGFTV